MKQLREIAEKSLPWRATVWWNHLPHLGSYSSWLGTQSWVWLPADPCFAQPCLTCIVHTYTNSRQNLQCMFQHTSIHLGQLNEKQLTEEFLPPSACMYKYSLVCLLCAFFHLFSCVLPHHANWQNFIVLCFRAFDSHWSRRDPVGWPNAVLHFVRSVI